MSRTVKRALKGSQRDLQILVNKNRDLIDSRIKSAFTALAKQQITWVSPIEEDNFAEYSDDDFLLKVGLAPTEIELDKFWPKRGARWDGLAKTTKSQIILVEAKANISELVTTATRAQKKSKAKIDSSLKAVKASLKITSTIAWSDKFYQYTNRLAHLHYLRKECKKPTFLVNIYFVGDETVSGPKTEDEWRGAIKLLNRLLGLARHELGKYMKDIFIHIDELKEA